MPRKSPFLTIREKRKLMADIVRDTEGNYTMSEKFKAVVEDTKLEEIDLERNPPEPPQPPPPPEDGGVDWGLLSFLPPAMSATHVPPVTHHQEPPEDEE